MYNHSKIWNSFFPIFVKHIFHNSCEFDQKVMNLQIELIIVIKYYAAVIGKYLSPVNKHYWISEKPNYIKNI